MNDDPQALTALATDPQENICVMASAGTGKTWLLVTRLLRLLLMGKAPSSILAITFTRKAAEEMQTRLNERLAELLTLDQESLRQQLAAIGIEASDERCRFARQLYEQLLQHSRPVRIVTFHAFCQELLHRFPLEAGIAADFELLQETRLLCQEALDGMIDQLTRQPGSALADDFLQLIRYCGSLENSLGLLRSFLDHRSDWWALTATADSPIAYACGLLRKRLQLKTLADPLTMLDDWLPPESLAEYSELLSRHPTAPHQTILVSLERARDSADDAEQCLAFLQQALLTQSGSPRKQRPDNKSRIKAMGAGGNERFIELHQRLCERLLELLDARLRLANYRIGCCWYRLGAQLIDTYQSLKRLRRLLDFNDLEWQTYRLLNDPAHSHWIQYKLDQRIDHLLIDEFQDTNPTQWRMILPLLQELAAGNHERQRSVFLVGDSKQSIYRFRRANPALFSTAADWLAEHLHGRQLPLLRSWRSAPAVIDYVNRVFGRNDGERLLDDFPHHSTHLGDLFGAVEILPLIRTAPEDASMEPSPQESPTPPGLRNPLLSPRPEDLDDRHLREGRQLARRMMELIADRLPVGPAGSARPIDYADMLVLTRKRTHIHHIERALLQQGIPFSGGGKRTLLDHLEIQDMLALLEILSTPADNLALAQVLRSPVFGCDDDALTELALLNRAQNSSWYETLCQAETLVSTELCQAAITLPQWRQWARQLPTHDLLDRIIFRGELQQRFQQAFPAHLQTRVHNSLNRLIELALEIDSGRYPSLEEFVARLRLLHAHQEDSLAEGSNETDDDGVRIMTIHAAKGLEAAAVFLVDSAGYQNKAPGHEALIDWPATAARPDTFLLLGSKEQRDRITEQALAKKSREESEENARLLYVALTRARQYLFISGCQSGRPSGRQFGWYGTLTQALADTDDCPLDQDGIIDQGYRFDGPADIARPTLPLNQAPATGQADTDDIPLLTPAQPCPAAAPENNAIDDEENEARLRGQAVHRFLDWMSRTERPDLLSCQRQLARELALDPDDPRLQDWQEEAGQVIRSPALSWLFRRPAAGHDYNEIPIHFLLRGQRRHVIIDRLLIDKEGVTIIDYKTQRLSPEGCPEQEAAEHLPQLGLYAHGIRMLWGDERAIRLIIVFTATATAVELDLARALAAATTAASEEVAVSPS